MSDQTETAQLVYIGMRERLDDRDRIKAMPAYQEVVAGELRPDVLTWGKPLSPAWSVGQVFTITVKREDGRMNVYTAGDRRPQYSHQWPDKAQLRDWQLEDRTARARADLERRASKEAPDELRAALAPIREAYLKARTAQRRAALLAAVIVEITAGR